MRRFQTLRVRLLLTYLFLIVLSLGVVVWRSGTWLDESYFAGIQREQQGTAFLVAGATEEVLEKFREGMSDAQTLRLEEAAIAQQIAQPLVVLDPAGEPLFNSEHVQETAEIQGQPEVLGAFQGRVTHDFRYDADNRDNSLFTAAPVYHDRDLIGVVRLELPMSAVAAASGTRWAQLVGAALLAALATVLISTWFARTLTQPLAQVTRAARAMAAGDLDQRIPLRAPRELTDLGRAFNFMAERLSRVMQDQRAFVANAAHELRTPLTIIQLRTEALREGAYADPAVAGEFLDNIQTETERLSLLVEELLDLSRIETGVRRPRLARISTAEVAAQTALDLSPRAEAAGVRIEVLPGKHLPAVKADPDQVRQIFLNLIGNAIKFTPSGGTVRVESVVAKGGDPPGAGSWVISRVCDTGVGIPAEDLPHIFERFYRGDRARVRARGAQAEAGVGLGLAIVKSIVDAHGGQVWAESEKDKGTTISVALRIA